MSRLIWMAAAWVCAGGAAQQFPTHSPRLLEKQDPAYSEGAWRSRLQGSVKLSLVVGEDGQPRDVRVIKSLGCGLDEQAVDTVSRWHFEPGANDGQPVAVISVLQVNFGRLPDPRSWHLSRVAFNTQDGATPPIVVLAPYPPPGAERNGSVEVSFDVNEQGVPVNIRVENSSDPALEDEVTALIREWRFQAAMRNGIPVAVHGFMDFTHGLDADDAASIPAASLRKQ